MNAIAAAGVPGTVHHACASARFGVPGWLPGFASACPAPGGSDADRIQPAGR